MVDGCEWICLDMICLDTGGHQNGWVWVAMDWRMDPGWGLRILRL